VTGRLGDYETGRSGDTKDPLPGELVPHQREARGGFFFNKTKNTIVNKKEILLMDMVYFKISL
jgi:hypothetical protein